MITQTSKKILLAVLAGMIAGLSGCSWFKPSPNSPPKIISQPQSQTVESGGNVRFAVAAVPAPLLYQWQFNGTNIRGANSATYNIAEVGVGDVGEYQVLIRRPGQERPATVSEKAYLSVSRTAKDLNSGSLTSPINSYPNNSDSSFCTFSFDKVSKYTPFDGPQVSPHSAKYPNASNFPLLTIATTGNDPSLATGIAIQQNRLPPPPPVTACGNNNSTTATATLQNGSTYRVGIYCKNTGGNITWTWKYHP